MASTVHRPGATIVGQATDRTTALRLELYHTFKTMSEGSPLRARGTCIVWASVPWGDVAPLLIFTAFRSFPGSSTPDPRKPQDLPVFS